MPSVLTPSLNVTVPVGVAGPLLVVTVAVNVTDAPTTTEAPLVESPTPVVACCTVSVSVAEVLPALFVSPPNTAVTALEPTVSALVLNVATPEGFNMPVPSVLEPSLNVIVPVGIAEPLLAVTVAVKVMVAPTVEELRLAVSVVVVVICCTLCVSAAEVLVRLLESPPYIAVIECEPIESALVLNVATPETFSVPVPSVVLPSKKVTVPVGTAVPGAASAMVAVNVTEAPADDGSELEERVVVVNACTVSVNTADTLSELFWSPP